MLSVDVAAQAVASPFRSPSSPSTPTSTMERDIQAMERNANATLASFHLHLPVAGTMSPRPASCVRPPCLKSPVTQGTVSQPTEFASMLPTSAVSTPRLDSPCGSQTYSFSAPRCMSFARRQAIRRQVHFDSSPPTAYDTFSADDYDRSQIECTQGGSELDLRLPSKCKRYNSDGEEDQSDDENDAEFFAEHAMHDDDASSTASSPSMSSRSPPFMAHGGTGWACLRKGSVIGALHSPRPPACRPATDPSGHQNVSLPVHGVRAFGGLAHHSVSSSDSDPQDTSHHDRDSAEGVSRPDDEDVDIECDDEAVMEAAAIASLPTRSPNATPKPSPSIVPRWARCTDYFESSPSLDDSCGSRIPTPQVEPRSAGMTASLSASSSTSSHASAETVTPSTSPPIRADSTSPQTEATAAPCHGEQTPRAHHTPIATPEGDGPFVMDGLSAGSASSPDSRSIPVLTTQEAQARRPLMSRAAPFESMAGASDCEAFSPVLLSPSPSSDGSMLLSALSGMHFAHPSVIKSISNDQIHMVSTPSPLSSRCSSIDPWSGLSSSGDEGTTGTSSPCAQWSSCTSPELTPAVIGLASPEATANGIKQTSCPAVPYPSPAAWHSASDVDGDVSCAENDRLPSPSGVASTQSPASGTATTAVLDGARSFLEGEKCVSRSRPRSRSSMLASEGRSSRTSPPSTDEESPRRRSASRTSSSAPSSRRSSSSSSMRSSSLCMSMTKAVSSADDGDDEISPEPPTTRRSKSRSSSGSGMASSGKVKKMPVYRRDSFEDEGALGGF